MRKLEHALYVLLGTIAGLALLAMMCLTFVDVSARKLDMPIAGSVELTELLMVILIFAGLPLVSMRAEHVTFELVDRLMPAALQPWVTRLMHLLCAAAFALLGWMMWGRAGRLLDDGLTTAQLKITVGPFAYLMSVMLIVTAVVHAVLAVTGQERMEGDGAASLTGSVQ